MDYRGVNWVLLPLRQKRVVLLRVHVLVDRLEGRVRALFGEIDGFIDLLLDLVVYLIQRLVVAKLPLEQVALQAKDRIVVFLSFELFFRPVLARIAHGVPAVAIGAHFHQRRTALARHFDVILHRPVDAENVHPVDECARHVVPDGLLVEVRLGGGTVRRRTHRILVVLDHENDRQLIESRQVNRLVEGALLDGPVTEEAQADPVVLFILVRKGDAYPKRDVPADDPVASEESLLGTEEVHRPAFPPRAAVDFAEELGHPGFRTHPERQCKAVIAICRYHRVVTYPHGLHRSRRYGLLTDVKVQEPCNFQLAVHLRRTLFETALQQHAAVHRQHFLVRQPEFLVVVGFSLVRFERYLDVDSVRQDYDLPVRTIRALNAGCRLRRFTFGFRRLRHVHRTV